MKNELKINGFSSITEDEMMDINGGVGWATIAIMIAIMVICAPPLY